MSGKSSDTNLQKKKIIDLSYYGSKAIHLNTKKESLIITKDIDFIHKYKLTSSYLGT